MKNQARSTRSWMPKALLPGPERVVRSHQTMGMTGPPHPIQRCVKSWGQTEGSPISRHERRKTSRLSRTSARADMYRRTAEARSAYEKALALTQQEPERQFLQERIPQLK